jgi:hypothetical protein
MSGSCFALALHLVLFCTCTLVPQVLMMTMQLQQVARRQPVVEMSQCSQAVVKQQGEHPIFKEQRARRKKAFCTPGGTNTREGGKKQKHEGGGKKHRQ